VLDVALRICTGTINVNANFAKAPVLLGGRRMNWCGRERRIDGVRAFENAKVMSLFCSCLLAMQ